MNILRWQNMAPAAWLAGEALWGGAVGLGAPRRVALVSQCWMQRWGRACGKQLGQPQGRDSTQDGSTVTADRVLGCPMPPAWLRWSVQAVSMIEDQLVTTEQLEAAVAQLCHFCSGTGTCSGVAIWGDTEHSQGTGDSSGTKDGQRTKDGWGTWVAGGAGWVGTQDGQGTQNNPRVTAGGYTWDGWQPDTEPSPPAPCCSPCWGISAGLRMHFGFGDRKAPPPELSCPLFVGLMVAPSLLPQNCPCPLGLSCPPALRRAPQPLARHSTAAEDSATLGMAVTHRSPTVCSPWCPFPGADSPGAPCRD